MTIKEYISTLNKRYKTGISREQSYRGDLQNLLEDITEKVKVTNEPSRIECGAPDYILTTEHDIPIGFIEAKDIGKPLNSNEYKEQFGRYKQSLNNLIITDYLTFYLYRNAELVKSVELGEIQNSKIKPHTTNFKAFQDLITEFTSFQGVTVTSAAKLSQMMAGKARLLENVIENALNSDEEKEEDSSLKSQYSAFKQVLIHDLTINQFADIYAQTIAYGMFAARLHDPTLEDFSRQEAAELIPSSNPFLRKLFQYIAGYDLDERIKWIVDSLADIFRATNVKELLQDFGKINQKNDPVIHFYETFLAVYDPKVRKKRGIFYTPEPVVNFIVRAVDDILKDEFGLKDGLADNSKTNVPVKTQTKDRRIKGGYKTVDVPMHKVQILDPAAGTGTFLAEVVKNINQKFKGQQGIWSKYVENHLIPRLNGFELLMASYAMTHLKLEMLLRETGYKPNKEQRLKVYLTNSLEEHHPDTGTLFANWLAHEANEANKIKRDTPVMVVLGNPPYSIRSTNKSEWIQKLIFDYKKDLNEKKINLDDDYIKFIRYGQHYIDKTGEGILAYISNNSFLEGITHRQMRKHLLESFDKIYILDLHGNVKKKEVCSDGSPDQNVFDIMQGVSINIFVKTPKKKKRDSGEVLHYDLQGSREFKYDFLIQNSINNILWNSLDYSAPYRFFVPKDFSVQEEYFKGFKIDKIFENYNSGVESGKDEFVIKRNEVELAEFKNDITNLEANILAKKYNVKNHKVNQVLDDIKNSRKTKILYRPFDIRYTFLSANSQGVFWRPRFSVMKHFLNDNIGLIAKRGFDEMNSFPCFITKYISDRRVWSRPGMQGAESIFPLYLYPDNIPQQTVHTNPKRKSNLNAEIVNQIAKKLGLDFTNEKEKTNNTFAPIDILDYIYAILHSPEYKKKYKEFIKIDFPHVPYPKDKNIFWQLIKIGSELRQIHLLESDKINQFITSYPNDGDNKVTRKMTKKSPGWKPTDEEETIGRVWINDNQYFDSVPKIAWEFYIGGYQPAQKWLKDRHGRELSYEDIVHYQEIIVALTETDRLMKEIDKIDFE